MKINLKIPVIIIALFLSTKVISQQDAQYTNYMYNTQMVQPAYVGSRGFTSITALARTQWVDLEGAPETTTISFDTPIGKNDNMGIGLSLFTDKIGPTAENRITIDYAFAINFIWSKLTFGLKAGINEFEIDYTRLNIADDNDPLVQYNANKIQPRFGLGIYFNTEEYYLGISAPNILETNYYDELNIESFRIENLYLTEEESLNWFKSSSLYENYQNTCKDWDWYEVQTQSEKHSTEVCAGKCIENIRDLLNKCFEKRTNTNDMGFT